VDVDRIEARALLPIVDRFWTTVAGRRWCELVRRCVAYIRALDNDHQREVLDDVIRAEHLVRHTVEGESRERLREAFNTPCSR
jgi:hypothetical protein